ncbi:MbcA/ParS/Xre antitoxin family protein [Thauera sp. 63]|jgi:uncharacterized protein (DUF2384 family)|uniref:MbcA/ParS/Xre antitoxin family protein n=1 Tax=Thauera sp. 63 TaxID=497321 RepID=UPI0009FAFC24|nr:MbcA/ParS/Xre antitoxin family protein [Thauera sp. 63]
MVFESADAAMCWLRSFNSALGGTTPLYCLRTQIGVGCVLDTLGRIENGVFS